MSKAEKSSEDQPVPTGKEELLFLRPGRFSKEGMMAFACPACGFPLWIKAESLSQVLTCSTCESRVEGPDSKGGRAARVIKLGGKARSSRAKGGRKASEDVSRPGLAARLSRKFFEPGTAIRGKAAEARERRAAAAAAAQDGGEDLFHILSTMDEIPDDEGVREVMRAWATIEEQEAREAAAEGGAGGRVSLEQRTTGMKLSEERHIPALEQPEVVAEVVESWQQQPRSRSNREKDTAQRRRAWSDFITGVVGRIGVVLLAVIAMLVLHFSFQGNFFRERMEGESPWGSKRFSGGASKGSRPVAVSPAAFSLTESRSRIEPLLTIFFGAASLAEMEAVVRHPEVTRPRMERYYAERGLASAEFELQDIVDFIQTPRHFFVLLIVDLDGARKLPIALEQRGEEFFIDWESFIGFSETSWAEFASGFSTEPGIFRVTAARDDYFNYQFSDPEAWLCLKLMDRDTIDYVYGYLRRDHPDLAKVEEVLAGVVASGGSSVHLMLELARPGGGKEGRQVEILGLENPHWLVP
ncbi:MAG: hypothetical protein ACC661_09890 [Verrucomicrobiales bacterium]